MAFMTWTPDMSVGLAELDEDHQVLIRVINELAENQGRSDRVSVLKGCFNHLRHYAEYHFAREEAVLRSVGYRSLGDHHKEHAAFSDTMRDLAVRFDERPEEVVGEVNKELLSYLRGWLQHHILVVDMDYKPVVGENHEAAAVAKQFKGSHHWWGP